MGKPTKDKAVIWAGALSSLAYLLPNHYSPWLSFHQELGVALAFAPLLLWGALQYRSPLPSLALGSAALAIVPMLQWAFGVLYFSGDAWMSALYVLALALAIHTGGALVVSEVSGTTKGLLARLEPIWGGLAIASLISVAIAAHQWLVLERFAIFVVDMPPSGRPFANLAQPNQLATLLLLGIAGLMFLWESEQLRPAAALSAAALLVFGLVMTGSRSVVLTVFGLVLFYTLMRKRCQLRTTPGAFALIVGLYVVLSVYWSALNEALMLAQDANTALNRMSVPGVRTLYWASMVNAISRAPWVGYGWGQIGVAQTATALDYAATHSFFDSAHNLFLDLALWNGLPVTLIFSLGLLLWFAWQARRCTDPQGWVTLSAICMVLSHAMVEYPLNYAYFLLPVGLWIGALSAAQPSPPDRLVAQWLRWSRYAVPGVAIGVLALFVAVVVEYVPYEEDWRRMRFREAHVGDPTIEEPSPAKLLTHLHALMRFTRTPPSADMSPQELERMRQVSERYAYPSSMFRYAQAQALNGAAQGAQQTLRRLCKMQTQDACVDARNRWKEIGAQSQPSMRDVPFPDNP